MKAHQAVYHFHARYLRLCHLESFIKKRIKSKERVEGESGSDVILKAVIYKIQQLKPKALTASASVTQINLPTRKGWSVWVLYLGCIAAMDQHCFRERKLQALFAISKVYPYVPYSELI